IYTWEIGIRGDWSKYPSVAGALVMAERDDPIEELVKHDLEASVAQEWKPQPKKRQRSVARYEMFIWGPVDRQGMGRAGAVNALDVALILWTLVGFGGGVTTDLKLGKDQFIKISRDTRRRQLQRLEKAGLVVVKRAKGHAPVVTILGLKRI